MSIPTTYLAFAGNVRLFRILAYILVWQVVVVSSAQHGASPSSSNGHGSSLPRSQSFARHSHHHSQRKYYSLPPWNPSAHIDEAGFLKGLYVRTPGEWEQEVRLNTVNELNVPCRIRQVPGDGNCLFHSISLCLCQAVNGTQWNLLPSSSSSSSSSGSYIAHGGSTTTTTGVGSDVVERQAPTLDDLYAHSHQLRADAVACLLDKRRRLFLQGRESLKSTELVEAAALQYGMSAQSYCESMQEDSVWGGGPEIVALCNLLQRPIHVYELATVPTDDTAMLLSQATGCGTAGFVLRRMACFGSPRFDRQQALHILSADSRFPDLKPGQQLSAGNHFLAVFPLPGDDDDEITRRPQRKRLRGGDIKTALDGDGGAADEDLHSASISQPLLKRAASKYIQWWRETFQNYL